MSRHKHHKMIEKIVLGEEYPQVHRWMDEPAWKWKMGKRHRRVRHHPVVTPLEIILRRHISGQEIDVGEVLSSLIHIIQDRVDSFLGLTKIIEEVEKAEAKSSSHSSRSRRRRTSSRSKQIRKRR